MHAWAEEHKPLHLIEEDKPEEEPKKAISCYGLWRKDTDRVLIRFHESRPVSAFTCAYLQWVLDLLHEEGKAALLLIWDNAGWHLSNPVKGWIKEHNRKAKREGGVRVLAHRLPRKSPWLNPIEPKWIHGKRATVEPNAVLSPEDLMSRVYDHFHSDHLKLLMQLTP